MTKHVVNGPWRRRAIVIPLAAVRAAAGAVFAFPAAQVGVRPADRVPAMTDSAMYARISAVRDRASHVAIDGAASDWAGIPTLTDATGDAEGDGSRDIVRTAIAPRQRDLLVMIETAGKPSPDDLAFWFNIDLLGSQQPDLQIGVSRRSPSSLWIFPEGQPPTPGSVAGLEVAIGDVVEIRIPFDVLALQLPPDIRAALTTARARPWLRVSPFSWNYRTRRYVDYGSAVASYRLIDLPSALDAPLPQPGSSTTIAAGRAPRSVELPLADGKWFMWQGPFGAGTHKDAWSYDLAQVDDTLQPSRVRDSARNEDYFSWGHPVVAPESGVVRWARSTEPDGAPGGPHPTALSNGVWIDIPGNTRLQMVHFQQGSVPVAEGAVLTAGTSVGRIGNSGPTSWAHLHLDLLQLPEGKLTMPLAFSNVEVSLNLATDDLWARVVSGWQPREGVFVQRHR